MAYSKAIEALADPTRRAVFEKLRRGPSAVGRLSEGLHVTRPAVSQHLKVLEGAGLVRARREGTRRIYSVEVHGLGRAAELPRSLLGRRADRVRGGGRSGGDRAEEEHGKR